VLDHPLDRLPDHVTTLWERSVRLASLLLLDKDLRQHPEAGTPALDAVLHRALDDLVGSLAPFVRAFPTARTLDDRRGKFLLSPQLLEPALRFIGRAEQQGVVTPAVGRTLRQTLQPALPDNAQTEKLTEYGYRGVNNLMTSVGLVGAHHLQTVRAGGVARPSALVRQTGTLLSEGAADVQALAQTYPADLQAAWGHLPVALTVTLAGGTFEDPPPPPDPAFWPGNEKPGWADQWGTDRHGRWVSFTVTGRDGKPVIQRMRWIPPGDFLMGSPDTEAGRFDEGPQTPVKIEAGFWLFDTPCTQALWQAVMGNNPSYFQSPDRPVDTVSFDQVRDFLRDLNRLRPGLALSLPSEARWEYACRAGNPDATYAGNLTILGDNNAPALDPIAWYGGNSGRDFELPNGINTSGWKDKQYPDTRAGTHPVGRKAPNRWGLYDMLGNVWEWCEDVWNDTHDGAAPDGAARQAPAGAPAGGADRVVRGGSWVDDARNVRAACRNHVGPARRDNDAGFRPARVQGHSESASEERRAGVGRLLNRFFSFFRRTESKP